MTKNKLADICERIADIVEHSSVDINKYGNLIETFRSYSVQFRSASDYHSTQQIIREILQLYRQGMCGMQDVVLMRNGIVLADETKLLHDAYHILFEQCVSDLS